MASSACIVGRASRPSSVAALLCVWMAASGCNALFNQPVASAGPQALNWLTNLVPPAVEPPAAPDVAALKPPDAPAGFRSGDLLEVTVWDLYEPGRAHTFPSRVDEAGMIEAPFVGGIEGRGDSPREVEKRLAEALSRQELLKQPRILVRELDAPPTRIFVTGAVQRPGLVELPHREVSVYAAIVSAGGFRKTAGSRVLVSHRSSETPKSTTPDKADSDKKPKTEASEKDEFDAAMAEMERGADSTKDAVVTQSKPASAAPEAQASEKRSPEGQWFDLARERDRQMLSVLQLSEGDTLMIPQSMPPVRIVGAVVQPGSYPLPAGDAINIWEALQMARGLKHTDIPLLVTLTRPASEERSAQRWSFTLKPGDPWPMNAPFVHSGDTIHVEPTTRGRLQRVVSRQ